MDIANYMHAVEDIERSIFDDDLDTLVCGMGPTGHLLPWIDRKILRRTRLWASHDFHRIMPVNDLVLFDSPAQSPRLKYGTPHYETVLRSRPDRLWLYAGNAPAWRPFLHNSMLSVTEDVDFWVWHNQKLREGEEMPKKFELEWSRPHCGWVSPIGCTTLAWREGCRRIGVLGVDMNPDHHTYKAAPTIDKFFVEAAKQAHEKGGLVKNLSPITALKRFASWTPSESSSEPSPPSDPPSSCSSTASVGAQPLQ